MGNNVCKSPDNEMFSEISQIYWTELDKDKINDRIEEKVKLNITITNSRSQTYKVTFSIAENANSVYNPKGETMELNSETGVIKFPNIFSMDYYFEKHQYICFTINCGGDIHEVKTTLGRIMGSKKQLYKYNLPDGEVLEIQGQVIKGNVKRNVTFIASVNGKLFKNGICFIIKNCGTQNVPLNTLLYKSEVLKGENLHFKSITIPTTQLSSNNDHADSMLSIEVYCCKHKKLLGENTNSLASFLRKPTLIHLNEGGSFEIECKIKTQYTFLEYLKRGTHIALTIGIDFTGSNGDVSSYNSLHYIKNNELNAYEKAIKACGDIIAYYNYEQLFPVYGFGARLTEFAQVSHCFPLTGTDNPNIHTIDGVLQEYRKQIPHMMFLGPTKFSPLLKKFNDRVIKEQANDKFLYHILMILTDGQIDDIKYTINELVKASFQPVSVIIIGIGSGPFGNMNVLDADTNPFYDSNGKKVARHLVQFVQFSKLQNNGMVLAEHILEEIPKQVCEYYEIMNIFPQC